MRNAHLLGPTRDAGVFQGTLSLEFEMHTRMLPLPLNSETGPDSGRPDRQNSTLQSSKPQPLREAPGKEARRIRDVVHICLVYVHHPKSGRALARKNSRFCQTQLLALRGQALLRSLESEPHTYSTVLNFQSPDPRSRVPRLSTRYTVVGSLSDSASRARSPS